jgi:hypothetical protein
MLMSGQRNASSPTTLLSTSSSSSSIAIFHFDWKNPSALHATVEQSVRLAQRQRVVVVDIAVLRITRKQE